MVAVPLRKHVPVFFSLTSDFIGSQGMIENFNDFPRCICVPSHPIKYPPTDIPIPPFPLNPQNSSVSHAKKVIFLNELVDKEIIIPPRHVSVFERCFSFVAELNMVTHFHRF